MPQTSWVQQLTETVARPLARLAYVIAFRLRCEGRQHYPARGGALICSNHQSHLDPVLIGLTCDRRLNYLARKSLFRFPIFGRLIRFFDAIPIDRDGLGLSGIKESLRRLKRGELLLIFPEGTRTIDGELSRLKPGFCSLARRAKVPIVPIGFDGAYDAWPRSRALPRPAVIHVCIGQPIPLETIASLTDEQLIEVVQERIRRCFQRARNGKLGRGFSNRLEPRGRQP